MTKNPLCATYYNCVGKLMFTETERLDRLRNISREFRSESHLPWHLFAICCYQTTWPTQFWRNADHRRSCASENTIRFSVSWHVLAMNNKSQLRTALRRQEQRIETLAGHFRAICFSEQSAGTAAAKNMNQKIPNYIGLDSNFSVYQNSLKLLSLS